MYSAVQTPFGRFTGALGGVRPDDLASYVISALLERDPRLEGAAVDELIFRPADNRETYAALELAEPDRALSITPSLNSLLAWNDGLEPAEDLRYELELGSYATGLRAGAD